ncbi:protein SHQ1 homolog [Drosophila novamexicana]|uniref:protein SHQ1 homolog n=1 Tax=Drosophila novamexicana TaxID=47314 RepID=UPI0011E5EE09|nr:protein SHQ1 homolog [Drosophila novamexicana]
MLNGQITHSYVGNTCSVVIPHPHVKEKPKSTPSPEQSEEACCERGAVAAEAETAATATVAAVHVNLDRIRNVDIFIGDNDLYFYADVKLYRFHSRRTFDLRGLKTLYVKYDTTENCYQLYLRCLPPVAIVGSGSAAGSAVTPKPKTARKEYIAAFLNLPSLADTLQDKEPLVHEWKLKRITEQCQLQLDAHERTYKMTSNFCYGYASRYNGSLQTSELDRSTCRVPEPDRLSPLQRRLERVADEMKRFSREQYKMNFVELQVPAGHQNPLRYKPKIYETSMTQEQAHLLHNLCSRSDIAEESTATALFQSSQPDRRVQNEIDCGLISIVLAICYDVRTTNNEPTCESGWTRSILCPLFCYFEQFDNYRDVLVAFLRRVITYPLYRNFELGRQCIRDAIEVLKGGRNWLINQLLLTHQQFASGEPCRDSFNNYYLEDYIRYISNATVCSDEHLRLLARNVKNVLMDVTKRQLDLGVIEIETELIQELMQEMRIDAGSGSESPSQQQSNHGDDDMDMDNDTSGQEDETTTDDDSVITDSFDSMDLRLIENDVYAVDEDNEGDADDGEEEQSEVDDDDHDSNSSTTTTSDAEGNSVIEQCTSNSEAAASISASASTSTK